MSGFFQQQVAAAAGGETAKAQAFQDAITQLNLQIVAVQKVLPQVQALQAQIADAQKVISDAHGRAGRRGRQARRDQRRP